MGEMEKSKLNLAELSQAPEPQIETISYNYVVLTWPEVSNQRSYIIEEKDEYGIGRVYVGASSSCRLSGLESLSTHNYRLVLPTDNGQLTSKWISVLTTKEPVTADYITRACRSADLPRLKSLMQEVIEKNPRSGQLFNSLDSKGVSPLMMCAQEGFVPGICLLLEQGVDINRVNNDGKTALMWAAINGHTEAVNLIIDSGADMTMKDRSGTNCLYAACDSDQPATVAAILTRKVIDVNEFNASGWTVLHKLAAVNNHEAAAPIAEQLIQAGALGDLRDNNGNTPLLLAMLSDNQHVVKALLAVKASCTLSNNKSNNPLKLAASDDYVARNKRAKAIATMVKASQL